MVWTKVSCSRFLVSCILARCIGCTCLGENAELAAVLELSKCRMLLLTGGPGFMEGLGL